MIHNLQETFFKKKIDNFILCKYRNLLVKYQTILFYIYIVLTTYDFKYQILISISQKKNKAIITLVQDTGNDGLFSL